mmetsp:Transcript_13629/g.39785  ORF Transcript_13629/g.39785 Transcript_13629/m.39785 type:complete len:255 (+) Transcript_13629:78-842(+)
MPLPPQSRSRSCAAPFTQPTMGVTIRWHCSSAGWLRPVRFDRPRARQCGVLQTARHIAATPTPLIGLCPTSSSASTSLHIIRALTPWLEQPVARSRRRAHPRPPMFRAMAATPWSPRSLCERSRICRFGDSETRFRSVACASAVREQDERARLVSPMLRHSAIMARPSSPTGFLFRIMTCRSCVSAAPWSRNSSKCSSVRPISSRNMVRILLCSMAPPISRAPRGSISLPEMLTSTRVSHPRIMLPIAAEASWV